MRNTFLTAFVAGFSFAAQVQAAPYIVKFKDSADLKKVQKGLSSEVMDLSFGRFAKVELDGRKSLKKLRSLGDVEYIVEDYEINLDNTFSGEEISEDEIMEEGAFKKRKKARRYKDKDALLHKQWAVKNRGDFIVKKKFFGLVKKYSKEGVDLKAFDVWNSPELSASNKEIVIAVIDTGVDYNHPDLKNNIWVNKAELNGLPGVDDDNNGFVDDIHGADFVNNDSDPMDDQGHGTHCSGIIGAEHNASGIRGLMPRIKIMPLKFLSAKGSGSLSGALKAIDYAVKNGAHIMSNSWGGGPKNEALDLAIKAASDAGVYFVAAAGNGRPTFTGKNKGVDNDRRPTYPASYNHPNVISVGAMDAKGNSAVFSNYGQKSVHVFAPGHQILSTIPQKKYKAYSGTSMATPYVSAALGLLLQNSEGITMSEAREKLIKTSRKVDSLKGLSQSDGFIDVFALLQ